MGEKLVVGPINNGWTTSRKPFVIDNDSFPVLINASQWRGRIRRKRGTSKLSRLKRFMSSSQPYSSVTNIVLNGSGIGNLVSSFSLQSNSQIVPGTLTFTDTTGPQVYTDNSDGTLTGDSGGTGVIDYSIGQITVTGGAGHTINTISFSYYPILPVLGIEDFQTTSSQYAKNISFDTTYAYTIDTNFPHDSYSISFYKNPTSSGTYVAKSPWTALKWNGANYQQFWSTNYQSAMWATNGINVPFSSTNVGMQYIEASKITSATRMSAITVDFVIPADPTVQLTIGDFVFANEFSGASASTLNFQTGYVTTIVGTTYTITFPNANIGAAGLTPGILQCLTCNSDNTKDCIRWIDGFPVNGANPPVFTNGKGWVNFCPPLSKDVYSIGDKPQAQWYLVSARLIVPFKDRLLFFGPVIQTSTAGSQTYIPDLVIYSQNGTPYYTASFQGSPEVPTSITPLLVAGIDTPTPNNTSNGQTGSPAAFFCDVPGFGGFIQAGIDEPIVTVSSNEDVLIVGFTTVQTRFVYTGIDFQPFAFFLINSELGTQSTFSAINFDDGVITIGTRGIIMTAQTRSERIDEPILDQLFQISLKNNGAERVTAQRDFQNEIIYFSSKSNQSSATYPNQTYVYNYRENTWSKYLETYTTYGQFRKSSGFTWATIGSVFPSWSVWKQPWNSGTSNLLQPIVIAGNQQGFVVSRDEGTNEAPSLIIQAISGNLVTCPNHGLDNPDGDSDYNSNFVIITNALGTIGSQINNRIFKVKVDNLNQFTLLGTEIPGGTYLGGGLITRIYRPFIQTKQFPTAWSMGRKTRIGVQQYLLTRTDFGEISVLLYLSQDSDNSYNNSAIIPAFASVNDSLIYSQVVYTCPESTNLGLTPSNTNLQQLTKINSSGRASNSQQQIWHRMNTSLIGDTIQIGVTLNDTQMSKYTLVDTEYEITGASQANPCVLQCTGQFAEGTLISITDVEGMIELNNFSGNQFYYVLSSTPTTVTIDVDSTTFDAYTSGGTAQAVQPLVPFEEVELHGFILDVTPSQMLS